MREYFGIVCVVLAGLCLITGLDQANAGAPDGGQNRTLWTDPSDLESRDLLYGNGGKSGVPDATQEFEYIRGNRQRLLQDVSGRIWEVRKGESGNAEIASQRILWALGYYSDQEYFVSAARIKGQKRQSDVVLRLLNGDLHRKDVTWAWSSNPFVQSKELEGLLAVMLLMDNLELDDKNNAIAVDSLAKTEIYYVSRIRSAFGGCGGVLNGSRANPTHYAKAGFIEKTDAGYVYFHCKVRNSSEPAKISIESAKWISQLLSRLSDSQLSSAFKAGNFTSPESEAFVRAMRSRIGQIQAASSR